MNYIDCNKYKNCSSAELLDLYLKRTRQFLDTSDVGKTEGNIEERYVHVAPSRAPRNDQMRLILENRYPLVTKFSDKEFDHVCNLLKRPITRTDFQRLDDFYENICPDTLKSTEEFIRDEMHQKGFQYTSTTDFSDTVMNYMRDTKIDETLLKQAVQMHMDCGTEQSALDYRSFQNSIVRKYIGLHMQKKEDELIKLWGLDLNDPKAVLENLKLESKKVCLSSDAKLERYIKKKLIAQVLAHEAIYTHGLGSSGKINCGQLGRFILDRKTKDHTIYVYDNEKNYALRGMQAFEYATANFSKAKSSPLKLTAFYYNLNSIFIRHNDYAPGVYMDSMDRFIAQYYQLCFGIKAFTNVSPPIHSYRMDHFDNDEEGLRDLLNRGDAKNDDSTFEFSVRLNEKYHPDRVIYFDQFKKIPKKNMLWNDFLLLNLVTINEIFTHFTTMLNGAKNRSERLLAYAWVARELDLAHFFRDGNTRTQNMFLVAALNADPDFDMPIVYDPNLIYGYGPYALVKIIVEGMDAYAEAVGSTPKYSMSDFKKETKLAPSAGWDQIHPSAQQAKQCKNKAMMSVAGTACFLPISMILLLWLLLYNVV